MQPTPPSARRGRPRKVAAADPDTRQALIRAGIAMLTEQGFTASGIDGILKAAGVPKGSFYYYFPSKAAFGQAIVAGYGDYFAARLARCLTQSDLTPLARLQVFIEQSAAGMAKYDFRRGCLVGNLGQEIAVLPAGYRQQLSAILHGWQRQVADCLRLAQAAGEIHFQADCAALAEFFWIGWEGAVMRARLAGNRQPLDRFAQGFLAGLPR
ncbi:Transcriptional regulatory protein, TetR family [Sodalis praecaptivus]|uniref:Transcriptional regulatory protein, TetR family n=1 Tax=Sodalis praecaptivus TaxID=1239307 RepID=W0HYY6_9GAMM|nr:Transcriptional regulatory protein, TetR family [Sodalis praecaptivus]